MNSKTVIVFCAHPDDEVIGPGGTLKKYSKEGIKTIVVILSGGEMSNALYKKKALINLRQKESEKAGKILNISKLIHFKLRDMKLQEDLKDSKTIDKIEKLILKYNPEKIFTHAIDDVLYKDHKAVHDAIFSIVKRLNKKSSEDSTDSKFSLYTFNVWTFNIRKTDYPKLVVDISDEFKFKLSALKKFKSQKLALFQLYPLIYIKAIIAGWKNDSKFAEEFHKVL